jgi:phosphatidylinositol alpha-mannosyltransferase
LKSSDLLCSPAIFGESFGIVLLEGLASGLPIVAADNSGYRDVLKDVGSLSLVNVKDKAAFVRLINIFLNQTEIRQLYRQWAQDYIVNFDNQLIADQYLKYYYSLLQQR